MQYIKNPKLSLYHSLATLGNPTTQDQGLELF